MPKFRVQGPTPPSVDGDTVVVQTIRMADTLKDALAREAKANHTTPGDLARQYIRHMLRQAGWDL